MKSRVGCRSRAGVALQGSVRVELVVRLACKPFRARFLRRNIAYDLIRTGDTFKDIAALTVELTVTVGNFVNLELLPELG